MKLKEAVNKPSSNKEQLDAYYYLRDARKLIASSLLTGKREWREYITRMKKDVKNRKKKDDGTLYSPIDVQSLEQKRILWVSATTRQLRSIAEYEIEMLNIISNRGMYPTEETIEAEEVFSQ